MATTLAIGQNPGVAPLAVDPEAMFVAGSAVPLWVRTSWPRWAR
ncbi:hypothetical protein I545_6559 [Mycobacterium kansasii 662]|uniref:Uncharacterized protein n=1 Tax=Mycobacterium kansasii 662 TaxID=1299326 RepID=X7YG01_MYCKA|nr:hypothetical protein I545_6559 [Mycobacterium kansasii 662]